MESMLFFLLIWNTNCEQNWRLTPWGAFLTCSHSCPHMPTSRWPVCRISFQTGELSEGKTCGAVRRDERAARKEISTMAASHREGNICCVGCWQEGWWQCGWQVSMQGGASGTHGTSKRGETQIADVQRIELRSTAALPDPISFFLHYAATKMLGAAPLPTTLPRVYLQVCTRCK